MKRDTFSELCKQTEPSRVIYSAYQVVDKGFQAQTRPDFKNQTRGQLRKNLRIVNINTNWLDKTSRQFECDKVELTLISIYQFNLTHLQTNQSKLQSVK